VRKDGEFPLFDGLGSERTVTNAGQTVIGTISYDAFGQTIGTTGSSTNPYLFAATWGYRNDGDAGLMHVGARYYDAQVGRFLTRDTVLSEHPYLYCEHEPVNSVDPSGHFGVMGFLGATFGALAVSAFIIGTGGTGLIVVGGAVVGGAIGGVVGGHFDPPVVRGSVGERMFWGGVIGLAIGIWRAGPLPPVDTGPTGAPITPDATPAFGY
jgi:RHS repeat-associated protein